jgi:hypothetical protein
LVYIKNILKKEQAMYEQVLQYRKDSQHFLLPVRDEKLTQSLSSKRTPITYIGTVVFRKSGCNENAGRFDVYFIEDWELEWGWITMLNDKGTCYRHVFIDAIHSPDTAKPLFDCDAIMVFAEEGYYFVDEKTGEKCLKHFNVRHNNVLTPKRETKIPLEYPDIPYFNSKGKDLRVTYHDGVPC